MSETTPQQHQFQPGQYIFREGEKGDSAYIILEGEVNILGLIGGQELPISRLKAGDLFGEMALIDDQERSASARAHTEVKLVPINQHYVKDRMERSDPLVALFMKAILGRFRKIHASFKETAQGSSLKDAITFGEQSNLPNYLSESQITASQMTITQELANALNENRLHLFYQAVVDPANNRIKGFEALIRQIHPTRGVVSPVEFINQAETSGLIVPIGYLLITEACLVMQQMPQAQININLSGRQFEEPDLVDKIAQILEQHCPNPAHFTFEITESILMSDPERVEEQLLQLKALGAQIAIDDFGTGYSSFSYLYRFPIDILKIDGSFVRQMQNNSKSLEIVRALIAMSRAMNMEVVAEGVEDISQVEMLREMGAHWIQGYYYSKPLPMQEAIAFFGDGYYRA